MPSTANQEMFRLLNERPRSIFSMLKTRIARMTPEPGLLATSIHTGCYTGKERKSFEPSRYVSAVRGESVCNLVTLFLSYDDCQVQQLIR